MIAHKLLYAALVGLAVAASGCVADNWWRRQVALASAQEKVQEKAQDWEEYKIGPNDSLEISVWKNADISRTVHVRPDGMISLPLLNDVQAAGLTPMQLREVVSQRLAEYMPAPEVSIIVVETRSSEVSIMGEVQRPGKYDLRRPTTVLEGLLLAGGLTTFASPKRIIVLRPNGKTAQRLPFNYKKAILAGGEAENFLLQPGDIILVP